MDRIKAGTLASGLYLSRWQPLVRTVTFAAPSETLTNFPALVKADSTFNIANGYDVHFQTMAGVELPFELDFYDSVTGNGAWWVKIPSMPSGSSTSIKMIYGDESINSDQSSPLTVWSDYDYVFHFSGVNPLKSSTGTADATCDAPMSFTSSTPTGCGLRLTPSGTNTLTFIHVGVNVSKAAYTIISHASEKFCHYFLTGWYSYGFDGYNNPYSIKGGGVSFTPGTVFPSDVNFSGGTNGTTATLLFNGTFYDCSSSANQGWIRCDDPQSIQVRSNCIYDVDEIRVSYKVGRSAAWYSYEQNQMVNHNQYTTYSSERKGN